MHRAFSESVFGSRLQDVSRRPEGRLRTRHPTDHAVGDPGQGHSVRTRLTVNLAYASLPRCKRMFCSSPSMWKLSKTMFSGPSQSGFTSKWAAGFTLSFAGSISYFVSVPRTHPR